MNSNRRFAAGKANQDKAGLKECDDEVAAIRRALGGNRTRLTNLLRSLEVAAEVTDEFVGDVNNRRVGLQAEQVRLEEQLAAVVDEVRSAVNPDLLDCLPIGAVDLDRLPDEVPRPLFEAPRLEIHYDYEARSAMCRTTATPTTSPPPSRSTRGDAAVAAARPEAGQVETRS